jgi:hypothetical protein
LPRARKRERLAQRVDRRAEQITRCNDVVGQGIERQGQKGACAAGAKPDRQQVGGAGRFDLERLILQTGDPGTCVLGIGFTTADCDDPVRRPEVDHQLQCAVGQDDRTLIRTAPTHGPDRLDERGQRRSRRDREEFEGGGGGVARHVASVVAIGAKRSSRSPARTSSACCRRFTGASY